MAERMKIWDGSPVWVVCDIDSTLYTNPDYIQASSKQEIAEVAKVLGVPTEETLRIIRQKYKDLYRRIPREITLTETVYALGITQKQWGELRCRAWEPEKWLAQDVEMCEALNRLSVSENTLGVCFATNSPVAVGRRTLNVIGINYPPHLLFGPENVGCFKPDPRFFPYIAECLQASPNECISIGDRKMTDGDPAIMAGFSCAFVVEGRDDFIATIQQLILRGEKNDYRI